MSDLNERVLKWGEQAVKLLCEQSQHPSDKFDECAGRLAWALDELANKCQSVGGEHE